MTVLLGTQPYLWFLWAMAVVGLLAVYLVFAWVASKCIAFGSREIPVRTPHDFRLSELDEPINHRRDHALRAAAVPHLVRKGKTS